MAIAFALAPVAAADPLPMPPSDLDAAYDDATRTVSLAWTAAPGDVVGYTVYRNGEPIGTTGGTGFTDPSPFAAGTYVVTASTADGDSPPSNPAVVVLPPDLPWEALNTGHPLDFEAVVLDTRMCPMVGLSGTPPQVGINWECIQPPTFIGEPPLLDGEL